MPLLSPFGAFLSRRARRRAAIKESRALSAAAGALLPAPGSVALPVAACWKSLGEVEAHARACLDACGLQTWEFGWDRAVKRLGCCRVTRRHITLSRYFAQAHLNGAQEQILDTILHEIAHALAWEQARHAGHGPLWKAWCAALGATPRATASRCREFAPNPPRYRLQHRETGEVFREYARRPRFRRGLAQMYMRGRPETLGKLVVVEVRCETGAKGECGRKRAPGPF